MKPFELDARLTFDTYIVGAGNRLTCAAARRIAESPGTSYNPLFVYSASGLGKTHLLMAVGNHARRLHPQLEIVYDSIEHFIAELTAAIQAGERDAFRNLVQDIGLLLLDDVQFLAGHQRMQEELIRVWDALTTRGGQVVLASDRPPPEMDGLDSRLLSRFSGGLIVDIGAPDYETRVAIVRRKADERGQSLSAGVAEALARIAFGNVRELQGALNRLIAIQELEDRAVTVEEVMAAVGTNTGGIRTRPGAGDAEFFGFVEAVSGTVGEIVAASAAEQALAAAILRWEGEGFRTQRLDAALARSPASDEAQAAIAAFEADAARLREIEREIARLEPGAPELQRADLLRDPDRRPDAERLLEEVAERARPLPAPPGEASFDALALPADLLAVRAARAAVDQPGARYNPLFVHDRDGRSKSALLVALAAELRRRYPDTVVAYLDGTAFAADLIGAIERNRVDAFRARYRRADALVVDEVDALAGTERAQDELFHLFEALQRKGAQVAFGARTSPRGLVGIEDRLRSRIASGLVVEVPETATLLAGAPPAEPAMPDFTIRPWQEPGAEPASAARTATANGAAPAATNGTAAAAARNGARRAPAAAVPVNGRAAAPANGRGVVDALAAESAPPVPAPAPAPAKGGSAPMSDIDAALNNLGAPRPAAPAAAPALSLHSLMGGAPGAAKSALDHAFLDPEKLPREWPAPEAWLIEELD